MNEEKIINWLVVKILFLAWFGSLFAAITLKLTMFRIILPLIMLGFIGYIGFCTLVWFLNTDFEKKEKKQEDKNISH